MTKLPIRIIKKAGRMLGLIKPQVEDGGAKLTEAMAAILMGQKLNVVDVGGAITLQPHYNKFIGNANFYVFEPDERSYNDLVNTVGRYPHPDDFNYINKALSGKDGQRTLYLSNVPTGTSILKVDTDSPFVSKNNTYFFPMREIQIDTVTLTTAFDELKLAYFDAIKMDVQGAELEIIKGLDPVRLRELNAVEIEVGLHPVYKDQTTLEDVQRFMKDNGFGLYDVRPSRSNLADPANNKLYAETYLNLDKPSPSVAARLYEFDVIYFREPYWIKNNDIPKERILRIIVMYCVYNFFGEAIQISNDALASGKFSKADHAVVMQAIVNWNAVEQRATANFNELLKGTNYLNWGQYMWVAYPSN